MKIWRLIDVLNWSKDFLKEKNIDSPQLEAEWMLRDVLGLSRLEIYLNHDRPLSNDEREQFKYLLRQRATGKPLQYVLGHAEFMGMKFYVTPDVLIPRNDTEILVESVLNHIQRQSRPLSMLDICSGSGNIAISLAALCQNCRALAVDISEPALNIARRNSIHNGVQERVDFLKMDILKENLLQSSFDVIVSNPPYVAGKWFDNLPKSVLDFEPEIALNPGSDEFVFYRRVAKIAAEKLSHDGIAAVEIGGNHHTARVQEIFFRAGFSNPAAVQDYSSQDRVIMVKK